MITKAKFIDHLAQMYEIKNYDDLAKVNQLIDEITGQGINEMSAKQEVKVLENMDKLFKSRQGR